MEIEILEEPVIETSNNHQPQDHQQESPKELERIRKLSGQKHQYLDELNKEDQPESKNKIKSLLQKADKYAQFLLQKSKEKVHQKR